MSENLLIDLVWLFQGAFRSLLMINQEGLLFKERRYRPVGVLEAIPGLGGTASSTPALECRFGLGLPAVELARNLVEVLAAQ
jgi:hypothetical protein